MIVGRCFDGKNFVGLFFDVKIFWDFFFFFESRLYLKIVKKIMFIILCNEKWVCGFYEEKFSQLY